MPKVLETESTTSSGEGTRRHRAGAEDRPLSLALASSWLGSFRQDSRDHQILAASR